MKTAIIGAMKIEIDQLCAMLQKPKTRQVCGITYVEGIINDKQIAVAQCDPGKVNAAMCAQTLLIDAQPDEMINIGIAGGSQRFHIGDVAVAKSFVQYDFDITELGEPAAQIPPFDIVELPASCVICKKLEQAVLESQVSFCRCIFATADQFATPCTIERVTQQFKADAFDMESGAIAQVCLRARIPFGAIRVISDNGNGKCDYERFKLEAAQKSISIILHYLSICF